MPVIRVFLFANVLVLFWVGISGIIDPHFSDSLLHLRAETLLGKTELRALNGGVLLALGVALALGMRRSVLAPGLVSAVGIAMAIIGSTRLLAIVLEGYDLMAVVFATTELLTAAACAVFVRDMHKPD